MDAKPNPEVVQILSQALRDSQAHANQLKVELENALAVRMLLATLIDIIMIHYSSLFLN